MQLAFDPRDRNQAVHVLALIEALHPDMAGISSVDAGAVAAIAAEHEELPDPATAFAGVSPEQAFAPPSPAAGAAPPAPPALPAATTADATIPTPPPAASPPATGGVETDKEGLPWDKRIHSSPAKINKSDGLWRAKKNLDASVREQVVSELRQVMAAPGAPPLAAAAGGASATPAPAATESTTAPPVPQHTPAPADTASGPAGATTAPSAPPPPVPAAPPAPPAHDALATALADGWTPHPDSDGWYYKGQEVVSEADMTARYPAPAAAAPPPPVPTAPPAPPAAAPANDFAGLMRKITGMQTAGQLTVEQTTQISQGLGITGVRDLMHRPDLIPAFDAALPVVG